MAASDKVFIAALLLMAMLSISHRGVSAQGNGCRTAAANCVSSVTKCDLCKTGMDCIDALTVCTQEEKDKAKEKLIKDGCSGSGIPIISAMSLFVAALFHIL